MQTEAIIQMTDISKKFKGFQLDIPSLQVPKGFATALIGENGAGKSTLMNILAGVRLDYKGEIDYFGGEKDEKIIREAIGYTSPGSYFMPHWTIKAVEEVSQLLFDGFHADRYRQLALTLMIPIQMLYNLLHSQIVASSYRRRSLDGLVPNVLTLCATILVYVIIMILVGVRSKANPENANTYYISLVVIGLFLLVVIMFFAAAFKWFILSFVLFIIGFLFVYMGGTVVTMMEKVSLTFTSAALLGLAFVIAGNLIGMGIKKALYRKPFSLLSAGGQLKKEMR